MGTKQYILITALVRIVCTCTLIAWKVTILHCGILFYMPFLKPIILYLNQSILSNCSLFVEVVAAQMYMTQSTSAVPPLMTPQTFMAGGAAGAPPPAAQRAPVMSHPQPAVMTQPIPAGPVMSQPPHAPPNIQQQAPPPHPQNIQGINLYARRKISVTIYGILGVPE